MSKITPGTKFLLAGDVCTVEHQVMMIPKANRNKVGAAATKPVDNYRISGHRRYEYATGKQIRSGVKALSDRNKGNE